MGAVLTFVSFAGEALHAAPAVDATRSHADELWPHAVVFPDAGRIELSASGNGVTRVIGRAGAVPGSYPVMVVCANSGAAAVAASGDDGSFEVQLVASPGSWIIVKYDPTAAISTPQWLLPPFSQPGNDVSMVWANAAPGTWLRVPVKVPPVPVDATSFDVSGRVRSNGVDFSLAGKMGGRFEPGGSVSVEGIISVYPSTASARALIGKRILVDADLGLLFDERGRARMGSGFYFSNVLTPTALPVQTKGLDTFSVPELKSDRLSLGPDGRLSAVVRWTFPLSADLPPGTYAFAIRVRSTEGGVVPLEGIRGSRQVTMTRDLSYLPPFKMGQPAPPRLTWTLLTDVPGADGSRGTVAEEDRGDFELASQVVTQSHAYIIPKSSKQSGELLVYRLEPYLPMIAQGDRHVPNPPPIPFSFPSGSLTVRVHRPDGKSDVLGPAPFAGARSRAPATSQGVSINGGDGAPVDIFQLTTASDRFDYRFPLYGRYEIDMTGEVRDVYGNVYAGGGRYTVFVAEKLDLEPATLPMTPLQEGDSFNPGVTILPGLPAEVDVSIALLPQSDPRRIKKWTVKGRANSFGLFTQKADALPVVMGSPGEFIVEATARYLDADATLWMGALRWGQVVAPVDSPLLARGRRGRSDLNPGASLWFASSLKWDANHMRFPYASGDVLWQTGNDALFPAISVQDREGLVKKRISRLFEDDDGKSLRAFQLDNGFEVRARSGELPLLLASRGPLPPTASPRDIDVHGYFYAGAERPGERAREVVSDDQGVQSYGYWFFNEPYAMQPGIGVEGDLPNDFKFLYGGAVFRDGASGLRRYGIYGALWMHLPADDSWGTRVFPPFQGANGGPSGGPLMTLDGREIDGFAVPLAVRPGSIIEAGDVFSFSAAIAPTLPAAVEVLITGPGGFRRRIAGRANAVGYFYRPEQDFVAQSPGLYSVSVTVTFDSETSVGPMAPPFPTGSILGSKNGRFNVYVVDRKSPKLRTPVAARSAVRGLGPVVFSVQAPGGVRGTLHYTIAMPGFLLEEGTLPMESGGATVSYDPVSLSRIFPNIDVLRGRTGAPKGLVDTVWVSMMLDGSDGRHYGRHFTLQGPDLHAP